MSGLDTIWVSLLDDAFTVDTILPADFDVLLSVAEQGPPGSVNLVVNEVVSSTNTVIDYAKGTWQHLTLQSDITTLTVINWPLAGKAARLVLQIANVGGFRINGWPSGTKWPGGAPPIISSGAGNQDLIVLSTGSGGAPPIFGSVAGQNFS